MVASDSGERGPSDLVTMALAGSVRIDRPGGRALLPVRPPYHLYRTLGCGQAFRWRIDAAGAIGVFRGKRVRLSQTSDGIACEGLTDESALHDLRHYLGLDEPLEAIERVLRQDPVLGRLLPATSGLALLVTCGGVRWAIAGHTCVRSPGASPPETSICRPWGAPSTPWRVNSS